MDEIRQILSFDNHTDTVDLQGFWHIADAKLVHIIKRTGLDWRLLRITRIYQFFYLHIY